MGGNFPTIWCFYVYKVLITLNNGLISTHTHTKTPSVCSSTTLKLDGVKRVWGKEGYLVEEGAQVEVPSPPLSQRQGEKDQGEGEEEESGPSSNQTATPTPTATPEPEQERQQLASSLFVGLSSDSDVSLVSLAAFPASCSSGTSRTLAASKQGSGFIVERRWRHLIVAAAVNQ